MARRTPPKAPPQPSESYEWSEMGESRYSKMTTPERLASELRRFMGPDGFKPHKIVEEAKDARSYFHPFFEWNDTMAAGAYRLAQARALIASVKIIVHDEDPEDMRRARAFYSVSDRRNRAYFDVQSIRSSPELQKRLLEQVDRELQAIVDRHIGVKAIAPIIAEARRRLAEERSRYQPEARTVPDP